MNITVSSNLADNVVTIIDSICTKLGIAFDWSAENVLPKIQDLITRFATYRIWTFSSIFALFLILFIVAFSIYLKMKAKDKFRYGDEDLFIIALWLLGIVTVVFGVICAIHIPRCINFPELEIYRWAKNCGFLSS